MRPGGNPLAKLDRQSVIGILQATGSRDPDVLHARKRTLLSRVKLPSLAGTGLMIGGLALSFGALQVPIALPVGLPVLLGGIWIRQRGVRNAATVEAAYSEFIRSLGL